MNKLFTSNDLLSFDFIHDNPNNINFFKENPVFNLNDFTTFQINKDLLKPKIHENIEEYVKNIMLNNFEHYNHDIVNKYLTTNNNINFKYNNKYTLIFDNMQCNIKNVLNLKMLLQNPEINIYLPFILCCENISVNIKNNNLDKKINNIKNSYNTLKNKLSLHNINVIECDFFEKNRNKLKDEYIIESLIIGFNYKTNKLLNFRNIDKYEDINENTKIILNDFHDIIKLIITNKKISINYKNIAQNINIILNNYNLDNNISKTDFNKIRSLILSMKEMRDWFYIKEIVKRYSDNTIDEVMYCTADSINLFRAILYNISTVNSHNNHIKYISIHTKINNQKYILYKQISPSYFYLFNNQEHYKIKNNIFSKINNENTFIFQKKITGGHIKYNNGNNILFNLNIKKEPKNKYIIFNINMDYVKLRLELYDTIQDFIVKISKLVEYDCKKTFNKIKNLKKKINTEIIKDINNFYKSLDKFKIFLNKYTINDLERINYNYEYNKLTIEEMEYLEKEFKYNQDELNKKNTGFYRKNINNDNNNDYLNSDDFNDNSDNSDNNDNNDNYDEYDEDEEEKNIEDAETIKKNYFKLQIDLGYGEFVKNIYERIIKEYHETINKDNNFYINPDYKMTDSEKLFTFIFGEFISFKCIQDREYTGYILKLILNEKDFGLIRHALFVYYDIYEYNNYIKGKSKVVKTFDENLYDYIEKRVVNEFYPQEYDDLPVEEFEKKNIISMYDDIIKLINDYL
jgi:hypothetical protein